MDSLIGTVPDTWTHAKLVDVCDILAGPSSRRLRIEQRTSANVPVVAPQDLRNNRISDDADVAVPAEQAARLSRYRIRPGDVVCSRTGGLGRQALVGEWQDGWVLGTACLRLRPHASLNSQYLTYYLGHPAVHDWITRNGAASTIPSLSTETLGALPLILPPAEIQVIVAEVVSAIDEKIAIHEEIVKTTAALRDAVIPLLLAGSPREIIAN